MIVSYSDAGVYGYFIRLAGRLYVYIGQSTKCSQRHVAYLEAAQRKGKAKRCRGDIFLGEAIDSGVAVSMRILVQAPVIVTPWAMKEWLNHHEKQWIRHLRARLVRPYRIDNEKGWNILNETSGGNGFGAELAQLAARKSHEVFSKDPEGYRQRQSAAGKVGGRSKSATKRRAGSLNRVKMHKDARENDPEGYSARQRHAFSRMLPEKRSLGIHQRWHVARCISKPSTCIHCAAEVDPNQDLFDFGTEEQNADRSK